MTTNQQWQPIETAPKDTPVLVWAKDEQMITAKYDTRYKWQLLDSGSYAEDHDMSYNPTHWMSLPSAPEEVKKE